MPVVFPSLEGDHLGYGEMKMIPKQHTETRFLMMFVLGAGHK